MNSTSNQIHDTKHSFSNSCIRFITPFFNISIALIIVLFIIGQIFMPDERDHDSGTCFEFHDNWTYTDTDGESTLFTIPGKTDGKTGEPSTIRNTLPDDMSGLTSLCIQSLWQDVEIYIDDQLRQSYTTKDSRPFGENSAIRYVFADLYPEDAGKTITITTTSTTSYSGQYQFIYIGNSTTIWLHLFDEYGGKTTVELCMLIISVLVLIICGFLRFFYKKPIVLSYLAWGVFISSVWLFSETKFRQLLFPNVSVLSNITFIALIMIPFPFLIYINSIQRYRYKQLHAFSLVCSTIALVITTALQVFGIADFRNTLPISHISLIIGIIVIFFTVILDIVHKKVADYKLVGIGILGTMIGAVLEIILFYITEHNTLGSAISCGLIFLLVMASIKTGQDFFQAERKRQRTVLANEAKAQFLANMSHEIRTPINAIIGMNEMILRENKDELIQEYANNIQSSSRMLQNLINDILDFSKIESKQLKLVEDEYSTASLIMDELRLIEPNASAKGLTFHPVIDDRLPCELWGDEIRIKQIMTNLLTNAVKYTETGSITLSVRAEWIDYAQIILQINISDTGIGIKPEHLDKLFESFARLDEKKNKHIEGTGLGLAITQDLVNLMNGKIHVTSKYGKGSTFTVEIPQKVVSAKSIGNIEKAFRTKCKKSMAPTGLFTAPDAKILVVDDKDLNLFVFQSLLKRTEIQIDLAKTGSEALEKTKLQTYDIIFLDHLMEGMDGIETLHRLQDDESNPNQHTPVIALTANAFSGCREIYLKEGFHDYLSKPIDSTKLEEMIIKYLPESFVHTNATMQELPEEPLNTVLSHTLTLDRVAGLIACNHSLELYKELLEVFCCESMNYLEQCSTYLATDDWDNLLIVIQTLQNNAHNIGAVQVNEQATQLETAIKNRDKSYIFSHYHMFRETIKNLIAQIEAEH